MTANLVFQIEKRDNVLTVPNAAFRFHPKPEQVRKSDLAILEGQSEDDATGDSPTDPAGKKDPAAAHPRKPTYVWVMDGNQIAAVEIVTGLADKSGTEIVSGDLAEGQEVITGTQSPVAESFRIAASLIASA